MGGLAVAKAVLSRGKGRAVSEAARVTANEVVQVHHGANLAADYIGVGSRGQPIMERAAFIRLEMAEADVAQGGKVDELRDGIANFRVHSAQPGVEQQRFIVFHQKMVELEIPPLSEDRNAIDIRRDFRGDRPASLLNWIFLPPFDFDFRPHRPERAGSRLAVGGVGSVYSMKDWIDDECPKNREFETDEPGGATLTLPHGALLTQRPLVRSWPMPTPL
jgi:hypothetical protein